MLSTLERLAKARELRAAVVDLDAGADARKRVVLTRKAAGLRDVLLGRRSGGIEDLDIGTPRESLQALWRHVMQSAQDANGPEGEQAHYSRMAYANIIATYLLWMEPQTNPGEAPVLGVNERTGLASGVEFTKRPEFRRRQFDQFHEAGKDVHDMPAMMQAAADQLEVIKTAERSVAEQLRESMNAALASPEAVAMREAAYSSWDDIEAGRIAAEEGNARRVAWMAEHKRITEQVAADFKPMQDAMKAQRDAATLALSAPAADLKRGILAASPVTEQQAQDWAYAQTISPAAAARLKKMGYDPTNVRADMAEFYRLTGGRLSRVAIETKGQRRANATDVHGHKTSTINLGSAFTKRTLFHELAHHLEADPVAYAAARGYLEKRREGTNVYRLRDLTGNRGYGVKEVAYKDAWFDAYVGKVYAWDTTEVLSMGVESFCDDFTLASRIKADPEMFAMLTGFLRSTPDPLFKVAQRVLDQVAQGEDAVKQEAESEADGLLRRMAAGVEFKATRDPARELPYIAYHYKARYVGTYRGLDLYESSKLRDRHNKRPRRGHILLHEEDGEGTRTSWAPYFEGIEQVKAAARIWARFGEFPSLTNAERLKGYAEALSA